VDSPPVNLRWIPTSIAHDWRVALRNGPALAAILFVWFAATAWIRPLAMPDEGRYVSVAWEMLVRGEWAVPTLDGLPFFHKPPLYYWMAAAAMRLVGVSDFAARLPSIVAATALVWALHRFTQIWFGRAHARVAVVVLATTPYLYFAAQYANMDMLVASCIGCAVLLGAHAVLCESDGTPARAAVWGAYSSAALGVLAKGLIGCALPAAILLAWLVVSRRATMARVFVSPVGLALFLAIALPWPLAMQARFPGFFDYFVVEQHFHRFIGTGFNNTEPWWFYVPVLLAFTLPWSLALPAALVRSNQTPASGAPSARSLMLCWIAVTVIFFSVPQSKLIGYAVPAAAPLAWLASEVIASLGVQAPWGRNVRSIASGAAIAMFVCVVAYGIRSPHSASALAAIVAKERRTGDRVVFLDTYPFDLIVQARIRQPVPVAKSWQDPRIAASDGWAKELSDSARFAPALAAGVLVEESSLESLTAGRPTWIVSPNNAKLPPGLHARLRARTDELTLWRVDS